MKHLKIFFIFLVLGGLFVLPSCTTWRVFPRGIAYMSCVSPEANPGKQRPNDAKIKVQYTINPEKGNVTVVITNLTNQIMTIDKTKSFFQNQEGVSFSYYDPTVSVQTTATTSSLSSSGGVSVGTIVGAITIGGTSGTATTSASTTYDVDQPKLTIGPRGQVELKKKYCSQMGKPIASRLIGDTKDNYIYQTYTQNNSYNKFGIYLTFSVDDGQTWDRIDADFYANTIFMYKLKNTLDMNSALQELYRTKPDVFLEPWAYIYFDVKMRKKYVVENNTIPYYDYWLRREFVNYK